MLKKIISFLSDFSRRFKASVTDRGIYYSALFLFSEIYYDRKFKLLTPNLQHNLESTINQSLMKDSYRNVSGSFYFFFKALSKAKVNPRSSCFIDIGCGTGKMLCAAISAGFIKVTGIDLDEKGLEIARANCLMTQKRIAPTDFEIIHTDASLYPIPVSISVIYMYNPFGEKTMAAVIKNIKESYQLAPRRICIIYENPTYENRFVSEGFTIVDRIRSKKSIDSAILELK